VERDGRWINLISGASFLFTWRCASLLLFVPTISVDKVSSVFLSSSLSRVKFFRQLRRSRGAALTGTAQGLKGRCDRYPARRFSSPGLGSQPLVTFRCCSAGAFNLMEVELLPALAPGGKGCTGIHAKPTLVNGAVLYNASFLMFV
jgi:hypothetical protein